MARHNKKLAYKRTLQKMHLRRLGREGELNVKDLVNESKKID